ncbi:MAG TPA: hypothetical protein ENL06_02815 [Candidatus Portnoybacteria bacterium]|nr:hypothetical protein [Candidatus Portnoybacteria bacterium]
MAESKKLVFDIETIGEDFDSMDKTTQGALTHWIKKTKKDKEEYQIALEDIKNRLGLSPLTGEIVAIGVLDCNKNKGVVYYQSPGTGEEETQEKNITFKPMPEKEMLENFWKGVKDYQEFISFNGRAFDVPFLMARSAVHRIKPSKNLMSNRYLNSQIYGAKHVDLLDQLTFYGAVRQKGSLHLWTRALGIKSPKANGVTGDDVSTLFKEKKFLRIAQYNVGDLYATKAVYEYWEKYLKM